MAAIIRQATIEDAAQWLELVRLTVGDEYPAREIYDAAWIAEQLLPESGHETWVAEENGCLMCSVSFLRPADANNNPVANLGRNLHRPESYIGGAAEALLRRIGELAEERQQLVVARVPALENQQQIIYEKLGYVCVGYQPCKHILRARQGILFYLLGTKPPLVTRLPLSESLPQIGELATAVLERLRIPNPLTVRDGATGYPLKAGIQIHDATFEDFELWRLQALSANPTTEVSTGFNRSFGLLRVNTNAPVQAFIGQKESQMVAGLSYIYDSHDRCVKVLDCFSADDISMGALFQHAVKIAQELFSAAYVEVDILMTAPRLLKTAEQLGFVPVAYLPAFYAKEGRLMDVVKMLKLNMVYAMENATLTAHATAILRIVDQNFQDLKIGVAIINLLRSLPIFEGLGDGELRKVARLFNQKLYRPGEVVFKKGDSGEEAYIVMRGQVDILLEESVKPIASVQAGQIFGELAFLDGAPRVAKATAGQASILLVINRAAFAELIQREPHLGMVVTRNIALELSHKLRRTNAVLTAASR